MNKVFDAPQLSSALKVKQKGYSKVTKDAIGYFCNDSNCILNNTRLTILFSSCFSCGAGLSVTDNNFDRCTALFTARKTIKSNWLNERDEYYCPLIKEVNHE